jgi:hypothetical protein
MEQETKILVKINSSLWQETFSEFNTIMSTEEGKRIYSVLKVERECMDKVINIDYLKAFQNMVKVLKSKMTNAENEKKMSF